jgi:deazaflavin-dependent oxidoreductase (nitroreductase family)
LKKTNQSSNSKTSNLDKEKYLYLTTRGRRSGKTREIEIWFTHHAGNLYVIAEYATSQWVQNVRANASVQVKVAGEGFAAHARILELTKDAALITVVQGLSTEKYGWGDGLVIELIREKA